MARKFLEVQGGFVQLQILAVFVKIKTTIYISVSGLQYVKIKKLCISFVIVTHTNTQRR
jgi:hypothetical protein